LRGRFAQIGEPEIGRVNPGGKAGGDWIPDLDDGGTGMMTLEMMLMQTDGKRINLVPAWPKDWTADFKLHAPYQTTIEGHVANGKIVRLRVTPDSRAKDVLVVGEGSRIDSQ